MRRDLQEALKQLEKAMIEGFFGTVTLSIQNGKIKQLSTQQTYKVVDD